mmetsp:Transcript_32690/g.104327  ORF Transcript_32690/g.104327 Transcript_32690/m.104327 type:complete len:147 (+) Transcript_32690:175-615(+)
MLLAARHHTGRSMLLASLLAMCKTAGASKCGSQTLSSSNIPSVQACTIIDGNLKITAGGAVELPNLQNVTGDFEIKFNTALTSLSVPVLASVEGTFNIVNNSALQCLEQTSLETLGTSRTVSARPQPPLHSTHPEGRRGRWLKLSW